MTASVVLIDDHLLLRQILGHTQPDPDGPKKFTTGLWYHRLCRALAHPGVAGSLSRQLAPLPPEVAAEAVHSLIELPPEVGLCSLRELAWPMATVLAHGHRLNLLSLEAIAAAQHLGAEIHLAMGDQNPPLTSAAEALGIRIAVQGAPL